MMKIARFLPLLTFSALTACVVPTGPVEVTRYNRAAEGVPYGTGSFAVTLVGESASDRSLAGSPYLAAVAREMQRIGYRANSGNSAVIAEVRFGATGFVPAAARLCRLASGGRRVAMVRALVLALVSIWTMGHQRSYNPAWRSALSGAATRW